MENRINIHGKGQNVLKTLYPIGGYIKKSPVELALLELFIFRVLKSINIDNRKAIENFEKALQITCSPSDKATIIKNINSIKSY